MFWLVTSDVSLASRLMCSKVSLTRMSLPTCKLESLCCTLRACVSNFRFCCSRSVIYDHKKEMHIITIWFSTSSLHLASPSIKHLQVKGFSTCNNHSVIFIGIPQWLKTASFSDKYYMLPSTNISASLI